MFIKINSINKLNSFSVGVLGIFGLDGSGLHIQMSRNAILLAMISLIIAAAIIVVRKIIENKTLNELRAKSKNR